MCGIAGAFSYSGALPPDVIRAVNQMETALQHRGPNASGTWVSPDGTTALAATRLAIRDLRSIANQPFVSSAGCTVYNGELYDWSRTPFVQQTARTLGDTEVIHDLTCRDPLTLTRVSGMYAVATWRSKSGSLVLARDPAGEKPLYVVRKDGWLAFASELQALVRSRLLSPEINLDSVALLLRLGHVPEPLTIYKAARPLGAGTILEVHPGGKETVHDWWPVLQADDDILEPGGLRRAIIESVERASVSDVPTGIFLSGGIDSSVIAAAARAAGSPLIAMTLTTSHGPDDESSQAAATAAFLGMSHTTVTLDPDEALSALPEFFAAMDQPTVDGFNSYLISRSAKSEGLTVALSGVGGDEVFRGYRTFRDMEAADWIMRLPARRLLPVHVPTIFGRRAERIGDLLHSRDRIDAYVAIRGVLGADRTERLVGRQGDLGLVKELMSFALQGDCDDRTTSLLETRGYMRNQLLRDLDVFSMAVALEVRAPLLAPRLLALTGTMPHARRLRGKRLMKDAFASDLPADLLRHPKRGFSLPWERWLRTSMRDSTRALLHDLPRSQSIIDPDEALRVCSDFERGHLHWSGLWAVVALCRWMVAQEEAGTVL